MSFNDKNSKQNTRDNLQLKHLGLNESTFEDKSSYAEKDFNDSFDSDYKGDKAVVKSIMANCEDFCYKESYIKSIVSDLEKNKKSSVFYIQKDKDGNFEYAHFIPALYFSTDKKEGYRKVYGNYELNKIPAKVECVISFKKKKTILKREGSLFYNEKLMKAVRDELK